MLRILIVAAAGVLISAPMHAAPAGTAGHARTTVTTPNQCVLVNGGDYDACNVGNSGRGDLPYRVARHATPNQCVLLNGGDYNACNVGNRGRATCRTGRCTELRRRSARGRLPARRRGSMLATRPQRIGTFLRSDW